MPTLPRRETLHALARYYHQLQREHQETPPESALRRRIGDRLLAVRERFDRMLEEWVPEEELREQWRAYLEHHAAEPSGPPAIEPLVFRGVSDDVGSVVEIRGTGDDLAVVIDGALIERIIGAKDFSGRGPLLRFPLNDVEFRETFEVSEGALDALAAFVETKGSPPPWEHAEALLADGLIDVHFGLTPRGHRALAARR
jgi:hypothetical protein